MKKLFPLLLPLCLAACKPAAESPLVGEWQAVSLYNPAVEATLEQQKALLDTMRELPPHPAYGMPVEITSLDSFKAQGYRELEAMRSYYAQSAAETRFTFRPDSIAVFAYPNGADSARYSLEGDSLLVLNERALKTVGEERLLMQIETLTTDSLTLIVPDANARSVMRFRKVK